MAVRRLLAPATGLAAMIAVSLPILIVPYGGDDVVNRNWALKSWSAAIAENVDLIQQWMRNEGRFFPTSAAYGVVVWETFTSRALYTAYLTVLAVALGALVLFAIGRYTRRWDVAAVTVAVLACGVQFRFFWDGFTSFAGLIPFSLLLTVGAACLAFAVYRGRSLAYAGVAAVVWSLTITAYEVSLLMLPAVLLLLVVRAARSRRHAAAAIGALAVPTVLDLALVAWLRSHLTAPPAPGYTIAINGDVPQTALSQFVAALPLSQHLFGIAPASCPLLTPLGVVLAIGLGAAMAIGVRRASNEGYGPTRQHPWAMLIAGIWIWVIPTLLAGITSRWQTQLPLHQGYIYVVYESLGVALIVAALYTALTARIGDPRSRKVAMVVAGLAGVLAGLTAGTNLDYGRQMSPGPDGPDWALSQEAAR